MPSVSRRLSKRLPRMPFPPGTKEMHFDYEAMLNSNVSALPLHHPYPIHLLSSPLHNLRTQSIHPLSCSPTNPIFQRALEHQLTQSTHTLALIAAETAKETALLAADEANLVALERNAKAAAKQRARRSSAKVCPWRHHLRYLRRPVGKQANGRLIFHSMLSLQIHFLRMIHSALQISPIASALWYPTAEGNLVRVSSRWMLIWILRLNPL
jgi:kinetochore protein Fta7